MLGVPRAVVEAVTSGVDEDVVEFDARVSDLVSSVAIGNGVPEGNAVV